MLPTIETTMPKTVLTVVLFRICFSSFSWFKWYPIKKKGKKATVLDNERILLNSLQNPISNAAIKAIGKIHLIFETYLIINLHVISDRIYQALAYGVKS